MAINKLTLIALGGAALLVVVLFLVLSNNTGMGTAASIAEQHIRDSDSFKYMANINSIQYIGESPAIDMGHPGLKAYTERFTYTLLSGEKMNAIVLMYYDNGAYVVSSYTDGRVV